MTRTSVRTARAYRGLRTPHARPAAGGLLVGMAGVASVAAAVLVIPGSESHTPDAVTSQSAARPSLVAAPPALPTSLPVRHASRGGVRTALPPVRYVTRTVAAGSGFFGKTSEPVAVGHRPVVHPAARPVAGATLFAAPTAAPAQVPAADESSMEAPSIVLAAALLTLAGGGVVQARRRR